MAEGKVSRFIIERALGHADQGVTATYHRASYRDEKLEAFEVVTSGFPATLSDEKRCCRATGQIMRDLRRALVANLKCPPKWANFAYRFTVRLRRAEREARAAGHGSDN